MNDTLQLMQSFMLKKGLINNEMTEREMHEFLSKEAKSDVRKQPSSKENKGKKVTSANATKDGDVTRKSIVNRDDKMSQSRNY